MNVSEIINKAQLERIRWHERGYKSGKFILGVEIIYILLSSNEYHSHSNHYDKTFLGFPYVEDVNNPNDINFCPIEDD